MPNYTRTIIGPNRPIVLYSRADSSPCIISEHDAILEMLNFNDWATHSTTMYGNDDYSLSGEESNIYDGNDDSYYGIYNLARGKDHESNQSYIDSQHTWTVPQPFSSVRIKAYSEYHSFGNYENRGADPLYSHKLYLYYSGDWQLIWEDTLNNPGGDDVDNGHKANDVTVTGSWSDVTGVRAYVEANSYAYEGMRTCYTYNLLYQLEAYFTRSAPVIFHHIDPLTVTGSSCPIIMDETTSASVEGLTTSYVIGKTSDKTVTLASTAAVSTNAAITMNESASATDTSLGTEYSTTVA